MTEELIAPIDLGDMCLLVDREWGSGDRKIGREALTAKRGDLAWVIFDC